MAARPLRILVGAAVALACSISDLAAWLGSCAVIITYTAIVLRSEDDSR